MSQLIHDDRKATMRRHLSQLTTRDEGAAAIEHVVMLGAVVMSLLVGFGCLGQVCRVKLSTTSSALAATTPVSQSTSTIGQVSREPNSADAGAAAEFPWLLLVGSCTAFCLACGIPTAFILMKSRKKSEEEDEEDVTSEPLQRTLSEDDITFERRQRLRRVFDNNMTSLLDGHLKVRHVMSRQLTSVADSESLATVQGLMELKKIKHVMVTNKDGGLVGVVHQSATNDPANRSLQSAIVTDACTVDADADFSPIITYMIRQRGTCLPVTSNGQLVGVLTSTDFLVALQCALHSLTNVVSYVEHGRRKSSS